MVMMLVLIKAMVMIILIMVRVLLPVIITVKDWMKYNGTDNVNDNNDDSYNGYHGMLSLLLQFPITN